MSRSADIELDWGGEVRTFRLGLGQIRKLQEITNCGPLGIAARCAVAVSVLKAMNQGDYVTLSRMDLTQAAEKVHTREALRQGLLGAGVAINIADGLVREYVDERPLDESLAPATQVCLAAIYGVEDEDAAGESEAVVAAVSNRSPTAKSASAKMASTRPAPPVASRPAT